MGILQDDHIPPLLPPKDSEDYHIARLSAYRTMEAIGKECHRCGAIIEHSGCRKPGIRFVWCSYCWNLRIAGENQSGSLYNAQ